MRSIYTILIMLYLSVSIMAQKAQHVSAQYTYISDNKEETPIQAVQSAFQEARYEAVRRVFGERVTNRSDYIAGKSGSHEYENFHQHGETELNADWVETIKEEVREQRFENGFWQVTVYVEGRAKEITSAGVDLDYHILRNGTELRHEEKKFKDGDRLYLMFKAPTDGYLAVYVVDDKTAYCMLPYQEQSTGVYRIKANQQYLFFSEDHCQPGEETFRFTVKTTTVEEESVVNEIYLIFSPSLFTKKTDREGRKLTQKLTLARNIDAETFNAWLAKCRIRDRQMKVGTTTIFISK